MPAREDRRDDDLGGRPLADDDGVDLVEDGDGASVGRGEVGHAVSFVGGTVCVGRSDSRSAMTASASWGVRRRGGAAR